MNRLYFVIHRIRHWWRGETTQVDYVIRCMGPYDWCRVRKCSCGYELIDDESVI